MSSYAPHNHLVCRIPYHVFVYAVRVVVWLRAEAGGNGVVEGPGKAAAAGYLVVARSTLPSWHASSDMVLSVCVGQTIACICYSVPPSTTAALVSLSVGFVSHCTLSTHRPSPFTTAVPRTVCHAVTLTGRPPPMDLATVSDDRDLARDTVDLQDRYDDMERLRLLEAIWTETSCGITEDCEWTWWSYHGAPYAHRTSDEEWDDRNEELYEATWWTMTATPYWRTTARDYGADTAPWWPCYGEQLGDAYDSDRTYSYHGTVL